MIYRFTDCEYDTERYELTRRGQVVPLEPQVRHLLHHLIVGRGRVSSRQELLDVVWGHRCVEVGTIASRVKKLRSVLGDDGVSQRIIRNVRGVGYEFAAEVDEVGDGEGLAASVIPSS